MENNKCTLRLYNIGGKPEGGLRLRPATGGAEETHHRHGAAGTVRCRGRPLATDRNETPLHGWV